MLEKWVQIWFRNWRTTEVSGQENTEQSKKNKDLFLITGFYDCKRIWYFVVVSIKRLNAYQTFTNKKG